MNKRIFILAFSLFFLFLPLFGEEQKTGSDVQKTETNFIGKHIVSFDLITMGLSNLELGWGVGVNYEQEIFDFLAVKGEFDHWSMFPYNNYFDNVVGVGVTLEVLYYPFGNGLDKLYVGLGNGTEFIMYN